MVKLYDDTNIKAIADAIREKNGTNNTYKVSEMAAAINAIEGGGWSEETLLNLFNTNRNGVTTIEIPNGATAIPTYMFRSCPNLNLTSLPATIRSIGSYAFAYCYALSLSVLPSSVTTIDSYAFSNCTSLNTITFEGTPTTINSNAFKNCTNITTINVPWSEGAVANAPWGATNATINYNYVG